MNSSLPRVRAIRGHIRVRGMRRVAHGLFVPHTLPTDQTQFDEDLWAWREVLPPDAVFTHVTAARLLGWWLPKLPDFVPVFAATRGDSRVRRHGLACSRLTHGVETGWVHDHPIDAAAEVLLRCARDLSLLDLTPMVVSALRKGHVTRAALEEMCASGRPGVRRLRAACDIADPRQESAWEVILLIFHRFAGIRVVPQFEVFRHSDGGFVGRADLRIQDTMLLQEYDGDVHDRPANRIADNRRQRRFAETPYVRRGYVADDLINHDVIVLQEIDRALGRRFSMTRLKRWRRCVDESTYSDRGRERLQNRWVQLTGVFDWSQTA